MPHSAEAWARELHGASATTFRMLALGATFRFPRGKDEAPATASDPVFTKTSAGCYRGASYPDGPIRTWRTGQGASVLPVASE